MTRRRAFDWVLIFALTGAVAALLARAVALGGIHYLRIRVSSAAGASAYPSLMTETPWPEFEAGDRLEAVDGEDLRGGSALRFYDRVTRAARQRGFATVRASRGDHSFETRVWLTPVPWWWVESLCAALQFLVALLLLLRAPHWHLARRYFVMFAFGAALSASFDWKMSGFRATWLEVTLADLLMTCTGLLLIWNSQDFTKSARPVPKLHRALAVAAASFVGLNFLMRDYLPHTWSMERAGGMAGQQFALALCMVGFGRAYLRSDVLERRQIRWVLLGFYVNWVGIAFSTASSYFFPHTFARMVGSFSDLGVPVGILVSVLGYRWLDVDRLISAAASYTILGLAVLGTALAVLPAAAQVAAPVLGIASPTLQWLLTMALVLAAIPAHAFLWPRVDRRMFRERHQRMLGFARLLDEIGSYASAEDLVCLAGKRLNALLEPESLAVYVRADRHFAALLTLGRAKPEAPFERDSLLLRALGQRGRPLWADAAELSAFDRAALETVAVELIVPIRGRDELLAFVCLGRKRSGDIYTPQEVAHLGAVANRCAEILLRLTPEPEAEPARHVFHRDGDFWTIASGGKEIRLRDMRGLHYLATLLREPGREFAATDLVRLANGRPGVPVTDGLGDAGPIDARARAACRERLLEIEAERAEAERNGDLGRLERTLDEREALLAELMSASRDRRPASHSERARVAVTKAIKAAIERIAERHPELAADLSVWIHRGSLCSYVPEPRASTPWET